MRLWWPAAILLLAVTTTATGVAQTQAESARLALSSGITIAIPAEWRVVDSATSVRIRSTTDSGMSQIQNRAFRDALRAGRPEGLFAAHHPTEFAESVNLNAAPSPGSTAAAFANLGEPQIAKALEQLCPVLGEATQRMNQRLISCSPARPLKVKTRTAALTEFVRTGPTGFVHVWLVQFPDNNVVFTLTLSCLESQRAAKEPVLRRIWESMEIPG